MTGINQVQVKREVDMTFSRALRAMLRQAPNIHHDRGNPRPGDGGDRDQRVADGAHGVFDFAHERFAEPVTRLVDIGVKPFLVSAALRAAMAQRLGATGVHRVQEAVFAGAEGVDEHRAE